MCRIVFPYRKSRFHIENPGNPGQNADLGSGGSGGHFYCNFIKRLAQKLRRIILLQFGPGNCLDSLLETRKPFMFMVFGPCGRDHHSKNQICLVWDAQNDAKQCKKRPRNLLIFENKIR